MNLSRTGEKPISSAAGAELIKLLADLERKKYYLHDNGAAYQNEWLKTGGKWYWFQADSTMAVNTSFTYKDNLYFVDGNGIMLSGCWKEENGAKYYIRSWGGACKDMQMKIPERPIILDQIARW